MTKHPPSSDEPITHEQDLIDQARDKCFQSIDQLSKALDRLEKDTQKKNALKHELAERLDSLIDAATREEAY